MAAIPQATAPTTGATTTGITLAVDQDTTFPAPPPPDTTVKPHSQGTAGAASAVVRSLILKPLYFWYRSPLKLFRPVRVDYLVMARAIAPPVNPEHGRFRNRWAASTIGLLSSAVKKEGWYFIPRHILPPLMANSVCGAVLFNVYAALSPSFAPLPSDWDDEEDPPSPSEALPPMNPAWEYFAAGAVAGAAHAFVAAPLDALQVRLEVKEMLDRKHPGVWRWAADSLRQMGYREAYRGFSLTCAKDGIGYAVFFGVYESVRDRLLRKSTLLLDGEDDPRKLMFSVGSTLLAGAASGVAYQLVDHPMDRFRSVLIVSEAGQAAHGGVYLAAYHRFRRLSGMDLAKEGGWPRFRLGWQWCWAGFAMSVLKAAPATSVGLLCYELLRKDIWGTRRT